MTGHWIRLNRLFSENSTAVVIGADSGEFGGATAETADLPGVIETLHRADAVVISPGMIANCGGVFSRRGSPLAVLRLDWPAALCEQWDFEGAASCTVIQPEEALVMGADICLASLPLTTTDEAGIVAGIDRFAQAAVAKRTCGIPLIGQLWIPAAARLPDDDLCDRLLAGCRILAEIDADLVAAPYTPERFEQITDRAGVPVLASPGPQVESERDLLTMAHEAISSGASGVLAGPHVLGAKGPAAVVEALQLIVSEQATPSEAAHQAGLR